jgi:hypothetical protein
MAIGTAMAGLVCLAASATPALADPRSVILSDGSTLTVWEQRGPSPSGGEPWSIDYSLMDAQGTITGVVPSTADAAADSSPFLALDSTGSAVLVWSRFDGAFWKIAYTRFSGNAWTNFHFLTFGSGDDIEPRIGTTSMGSYLYYCSYPDRYLYAPVELVTGNLFAAPRLLNLGSGRRDFAPLLKPGDPGMLGGVDAPVVTGRGGKREIDPRTSLIQPGGPSLQGGTDVPVVSGQNKAAAWGVGANGDCLHIILVIPARDLRTVFVYSFTGGVSQLLARIPTPAQTILPQYYGADTAATYLPLLCS